MNRRELLTVAAVLAGVSQANAFGIGKEGARGGFGRAGSVRGGASGPQIQLSNASFLAGSAQGTAIGTLSVVGGTDGQIIQYVPHGFVHAFEKLGWVVEPHILRGTHHGEYSDGMRWAGEGEPVFPTKESEAA